MAFNLPAPQNLHSTSSNNNRGSVGSVASLGTKAGGNLPITTNGAQVINSTASNASGNPAGVFFGMNGGTSTTSYDATQEARVLLWSLQYNAPNRIQSSNLANGGSRFWLGSGPNPTQNYKEFFIGGNDTPFCASQAGPVTMCIDISDTSNQNIIGSFDPTDITAYAHGSVRLNLAGSSTLQSFFQRCFLFSTSKGSSNLPNFTGAANFDDAIAVVQGSGYTTKTGSWLTKSGSSFFVPCPFSIGNGADAISFDDNSASVVSPASNVANQENFRLTDNAMRVYFNPRDNAADVAVLSGSYAWGTAAAWDFDISNQSSCTMSGAFNGMGDITMGSSITANGSFNLSTGSRVITKGANINGINVTGDLMISGDSVTTFEGLNIGGALMFDTAGTYTITTSNIEEVINTSGGTVEILLGVNSNINVNTGPNINILIPPSVLTLTGLQPGTEVRVYETGTINELAGVESSTTVFTASIDANSVDIVILALQYVYLRLNAVDTSSDTTLPIQQQFDQNYENP
jgi:hypothetical protein